MKKNIFITIFALMLCLLLVLPASGNGTGSESDNPVLINHGEIRPGNVFVMTNASEGNEVVMYHRNANGKLRYIDQFLTGGIGSDVGKTVPIGPLGSQNLLIINENGVYLYAVNAGDDSVTVFAIQGGYLKFLDNVPSGGSFPVSLTVHDDILYVLNAGTNDGMGGETPGNITDAGASTVTSYKLENGEVETISVPAETGQVATCWIAAAGPYVRYVYAASTGSGTLTGYRVRLNGTLAEIGRFQVGDGALNIDTAISRDGKFLCTQNGGFGTLSIFRILLNGKLIPVDKVDVTEPVSGFQGIAAW